MEVNERIVNTWLNTVKKHFTVSCLDYGKFHNDIDILSVNLQTNEVWDCEIKVRTGSTKITNSTDKTNGFIHFVGTFNDPQRLNAVNVFLPKKEFILKRKFITTKSLFGSEKNKTKWVSKFGKEDIEVVFFDEITKDLADYAKTLKKSNNEILQILRLLFINQ